MTARVCGRDRAADELLQHLSKPLGVAMNVMITGQQSHRQLDSSRACLRLVVLQHIAEHAMNIKELPGGRCHLRIERWRIWKTWNR